MHSKQFRLGGKQSLFIEIVKNLLQIQIVVKTITTSKNM